MWSRTMNTTCSRPGYLQRTSQHRLKPGKGNYVPDSPLSRQDGTSTSCPRSCPNGGFDSSFRPEAFRYCQTPLRFCQADRCICGRGYSGQGLVPTSLVHGVVNGGCLREYLLPRALMLFSFFAPPSGCARLVAARREQMVLRSKCIVTEYTRGRV